MKKIVVIISMMLLVAPMAFSGHETVAVVNDNGTPTLERDKLISLSGRFLNEKIYFKLTMLNESQGGVYTLMREYSDEKVEMVDFKTITTNMINSPLLYCFVDEKIPNTDFMYVLYRKSNENKQIAKWQYCSDLKELCPEEF